MNLKRFKLILFLSFLALIFTTSTQGQTDNQYIKKSIDIDSILIKKKLYNKEHPSIVYRIQLYYGKEELSYAFKERFEKAFPNQFVNIEFDNPDWKTMVGNFRTRLAADSAIVAIKKQFIGAVVVKAPLQIE